VTDAVASAVSVTVKMAVMTVMISQRTGNSDGDGDDRGLENSKPEF